MKRYRSTQLKLDYYVINILCLNKKLVIKHDITNFKKSKKIVNIK